MIRTEEIPPNPQDERFQRVPFDFAIDGWDARAADLQASGDLVLVRLPCDFYGAIVVNGTPTWDRDAIRLSRT